MNILDDLCFFKQNPMKRKVGHLDSTVDCGGSPIKV